MKTKYLHYPASDGYFEALYVVEDGVVIKHCCKHEANWFYPSFIGSFKHSLVQRNQTPTELTYDEAFEILL